MLSSVDRGFYDSLEYRLQAAVVQTETGTPAICKTIVIAMNESTRSNSNHLTRRHALAGITGLAMTAAATNQMNASAAESKDDLYVANNGRIKQSVVHWCFKPMREPELIGHAARMGLKSVELIAPEHWPLLKKNNLVNAISSSHGFAKGFAHKEEWAECIDKLRSMIDSTAEAGYFSVITFSGFRRGLDEAEGRKNMVEGLKQIVGYAEKQKVTLCLEMLNSRVDIEMKGHPDYFCDTIESCVEICDRVGSERLKILFDIYHVQIMQGDIITRIKQFHPYIGHYHTAGNPGRNEIDDSQEIQYAPIMRAIAETKYQGYVGQEFIPLRDPVASLNQSVRICDV